MTSTQCDEMPESWNKEVISYATDKRVSIVTTRQTVIFIATATARQPNCSTRCSLFSRRRTVLRGVLVDFKSVRVRQMQTTEKVRRVPESRVQHEAKKTDVKIHLPRRAVRNTELRR
jgi:hypothetical protein